MESGKASCQLPRGATTDYTYDFGDDWHHEILLDGIFLREGRKRYPRCIDGAGACPPEDCGGIHGYRHMLEVLANPDDEEHAEMLEWLGGSYDPKAFNSGKVKFDNPAKRLKLAFS